MTEKLFNYWLTAFEEAAVNYHIHKNIEWLRQLDKSRGELQKIFKAQQETVSISHINDPSEPEMD